MTIFYMLFTSEENGRTNVSGQRHSENTNGRILTGEYLFYSSSMKTIIQCSAHESYKLPACVTLTCRVFFLPAQVRELVATAKSQIHSGVSLDIQRRHQFPGAGVEQTAAGTLQQARPLSDPPLRRSHAARHGRHLGNDGALRATVLRRLAASACHPGARAVNGRGQPRICCRGEERSEADENRRHNNRLALPQLGAVHRRQCSARRAWRRRLHWPPTGGLPDAVRQLYDQPPRISVAYTRVPHGV